MICPDLELLADPAADLGESVAAPLRKPARAKPSAAQTPERQPFPPAAAPSWARASGRAGEGDPLFFAGANLALLDAFLRRDPPSAGALRSRLALMSAAACAKTPAPQRRRGGFARPALRPGRRALGLRRSSCRCGGISRVRPPSLDPGRILTAAAALDLALPDPNGLASSLKAGAGEGDPVSAAAQAAALAFYSVPRTPHAPGGGDSRALGRRPDPRPPPALGAPPAADRDENSRSRLAGA